jgi:hypothetical protein
VAELGRAAADIDAEFVDRYEEQRAPAVWDPPLLTFFQLTASG